MEANRLMEIDDHSTDGTITNSMISELINAVDALRGTSRTLAAENKELRGLLRRHAWREDMSTGDRYCNECGQTVRLDPSVGPPRWDESNCADTCQLAAAIKEE